MNYPNAVSSHSHSQVSVSSQSHSQAPSNSQSHSQAPVSKSQSSPQVTDARMVFEDLKAAVHRKIKVSQIDAFFEYIDKYGEVFVKRS